MCDTINTNSVKSRLLHVYTVLLINIGSFVMLLDGRSQHISLYFISILEGYTYQRYRCVLSQDEIELQLYAKADSLKCSNIMFISIYTDTFL